MFYVFLVTFNWIYLFISDSTKSLGNLSKKLKEEVSSATQASSAVEKEEENIEEIVREKEDDSRSVLSFQTMNPDFHAQLRAALYPLPTKEATMREAIPALTKVTPPGIPLTVEQVDTILNSKEEDIFDDYKLNAITDPKDGDLYLFNFNNPGRTPWIGNVKKDTYRWKQEFHQNINGADFMTHKSYMIYKDDEGKEHSTSKFTRYIHYDTKRKRCAVHYTGSDEVRQRAPHGNNQNPHTQFVPAREQVKEFIEREAPSATTREILHKSRNEYSSALLEQVAGVRDANQLRYERRLSRDQFKLQGTERENAQHLTDYWGNNVVREFKTNPVHIEMMTEHMVKELTKLTRARQNDDEPMLFHYDTTFNCGQFYVSTLSVRHDLMKHRNSRGEMGSGEPTVPVAFLVHQNRLKANHKELFETVNKVMDAHTRHEFSNTPKVLVSDAEFKNGIWEGAHVAQCWRHLSKNVEYNCKTRGLNKEDTKEAVNSFFHLAKSNSEAEFEEKLDNALENKEGPWTNPWYTSYMQNFVVPAIKDSTGRWILREKNLHGIENGLTNNAAEGVNNAVKSWIKTHHRFLGENSNKTELYQVMMACKTYTDSEITKITRAYYDRSPEYELKEHNRDRFAMQPNAMPNLRFETHQETVNNLKEILGDRLDRFQNTSIITEPIATKSDRKEDEQKRQQGKIAAARELIDKAKVMQYVESGRYYHIIDEFDQPFDVHMGDKNECSCPATGWCSHLIAARYHWGLSQKLEVPDTKNLDKRIPPPHHPNTKLKQRPSAKAPKPSDFFDPNKPTKGEKRKQESRPASQTLKAKISQMDDDLMPPPKSKMQRTKEDVFLTQKKFSHATQSK